MVRMLSLHCNVKNIKNIITKCRGDMTRSYAGSKPAQRDGADRGPVQVCIPGGAGEDAGVDRLVKHE